MTGFLRTLLLLLPFVSVASAYDAVDTLTSTMSGYKCPKLSLEGVKPAIWGHFFLNGALEAIQYYSADFSGNMPCGDRRVVIAKPSAGCGELTNTDEELKDSILVVTRGVCTFADKSRAANARGASSVVIVNTDNGLFPLHGDDESLSARKPASIAVVLVTPRSGLLLQQYANTYESLARSPMGTLMGLIQTTFTDGGSLEKCGQCTPAASGVEYSTSKDEMSLVAGGVLHLIGGSSKKESKQDVHAPGRDGKKRADGQVVGAGNGSDGASKNEFEFVAAEFGSPLVMNMPLNVVLANPPDGCNGLLNGGDVRGQIAFIRRGRCSFVHKLENAITAGALAVVFGNTENNPIANPGCLPEQLHTHDNEFNSGTLLPSLIVGYNAGVAIEAALPAQVLLKKADVDVEDYSSLSEFYDESFWAREFDEREKQAQEIIIAVGAGLTGERAALARQLLQRAHKYHSSVP